MTSLPDSVRKQSLTVRCDSAAEAAALRTRLADFNRSRLIPVIEKVLAEASRPGRRIRLERLHVDLGAFRPDEVEALAPVRLYSTLAAALREAMHNLHDHPTESGDTGWIDLFESYLLTGALPYWAPNTGSFSLVRLFTELAEQQPGELTSVFRRSGRNDGVLDRIVHQLFPEQLRALVGLLEPAQADLILAYMVDVAATHRVERLTDLAEAPFERLLWLLVLTYLLQDPGSQFNRKVFVRSLLTGIADHAGIAYADILDILARALRKTIGHAGVQSSLPAVIGELVEDASHAPPAVPEGAARAEAANDDALPAILPLLFSDVPSPARSREVAQQLRRIAHDRPALEQFAARLLPEEFRAVVRMLEPEHAPLVLAYILDVAATNRVERLSKPGEGGFEILLRYLVLSYLLREPGSEFNRTALVRALLAGMAAHNGLSYAGVLDLFRKALDTRPNRPVLRSSLPGVIRELLRESGKAQLAGLPESIAEARALLAQLLPATERSGTPMAQALETALSQTSDHQALLARIIAAIQQGKVLDFEQFVADTNADPSAAGPDPIEFLKSALTGQDKLHALARFHTMLDDLLRRDLRAGRLFLRSQIERSPQRESLLRRLPPERFQPLLDLLLDQPSVALANLAEACRQLPLADRPTADALHAAILTEVLRRDPTDESDPDFFQRILRAIFPAPLPDRIRKGLATRIAADQTILLEILNTDPAPLQDPLYLPGAQAEPDLLVDRIFVDSPSDGGRQGTLARLEAFRHALEAASGARATQLRQALRRRLARPVHREHLSRMLPPQALADLVEMLDPNAGDALLSGAGLIASAFALSFPDSPRADRGFYWNAVLEVAAATEMSKNQMFALLLDKYAGVSSAERPLAPTPDSGSDAAFIRQTSRLAAEAGHAELRSALAARSAGRRHAAPRAEAEGKGRTASFPSASPWSGKRESAPRATKEPFYVPNAGLVLASPFLPHLFAQLEMLEKTDAGRSRWRDAHTATRAVHLLQYLVDGSTATPEPRLVWNKILCGLPPATPVERSIEPSSRELGTCDALLAAVLANWSTISRTSVAALRETFLQRQGKLEWSSERCLLQVQRKTLDVLLDQIPWSFRLVFHDWMPEPVYVTW